jgi:hypothetical protein
MRKSTYVPRAILSLAVAAAAVVQFSGPPVQAKVEFKLGPGEVDKFLKNIKDAEEAGEKLKTLGPKDNEYEPDFGLKGMPELPSLCKNSTKCEACFEQPNADLNSLRFRFEKLRKVNRVTKNMLRDSLSFGDAMAGLAGGLAPLAWAREKAGIRQSEVIFNQRYDAKYAELLAALKQALQAIAQCEEKIFGEQSWYERYGFIYYQFMAGAYQRPD